MEAEGYVDAVERITSKNRPTKSIYKLTGSGKDHLRKLLLSNSGALPGFFINFYLDLSLCNVLKKEEIIEIIKLKIRQLEMMIKLSGLYRKTLNSGTVLEVLSRSEGEIYTLILRTLNELLALFDENDLSELYKVDEIDADEIISKMSDLSNEEVL